MLSVHVDKLTRQLADDLKINIQASFLYDLKHKSSLQVNAISQYLSNNGLSISSSKTSYIIPNIRLGDTELDEITSTKCMGFFTDKKLSWKTISVLKLIVANLQ